MARRRSCCAAAQGTSLPRDFVECGVYTGILSLAVCDYVDFNHTGTAFHLIDTFCGIPKDQAGDKIEAGRNGTCQSSIA